MTLPLDPHSEVVDERRRWLPDWYGWLTELERRLTGVDGGRLSGGAVSGAWTDYTPTLGFVGGTGITPIVTNCAYKLIGKTLYLRLNVGATYSTAPSYLYASLPAGLTSKSFQVCPCMNRQNAWACISFADGTGAVIYMWKWDGTSPFSASGQVIGVNGVIEVA